MGRFFQIFFFGFAIFSSCITTPAPNVESAHLSLDLFKELKSQVVQVTDINQSRPGMPAVISYRAYDGREVLDKVFGSREAWTNRLYLNFECSDGYISVMETKSLLQGQFYFAYARTDQKDFTLINYAKDGKNTSLGPFYIVWTDKAFHTRERAHFWPYQVVKLQFQ